LKSILRQSIFGVELQEEAVHLTAFSLALAVCDALQPKVIWKELRFDKLVGTNLYAKDFSDWLIGDSEACRSAFRTDVDHDSEVMAISVPN
jgi:hypothetical protein